MTPQILGNISKYGVERAAGFSDLRTEDRERVRTALRTRRIDPTDVTGSAPVSSSSKSALEPIPQPSQVPATPSQQPTPGTSTKKRKAEAEPGPSQTQTQNVVAPSPTQAAYRQATMGGTAWEEGADAREVVEQQVDELYSTQISNVVGVQYYKGMCVPSSRSLNMSPYHDFAWKALLMLENKSASSENHITDMIGRA